MCDLMAVEMDGAMAFVDGKGGHECPYAFCVSPFWETKDYLGFEREWKPKLNAWMNGWLAAKREADAKSAPVSRKTKFSRRTKS